VSKKKSPRAAALAQFIAGAVENEAYKTPAPSKRPYATIEPEPRVQVEDAHWRGVFAREAPSKTDFKVRVFYKQDPSGDDQGRVFEVSVKEVAR
jgi:hypothetical protein